MSIDISKKWNATYQNISPNKTLNIDPCKVLKDFPHILPKQGRALDLACGMGANAFLLASLGLSVDAVDISQVAIDKVTELAKKENLSVSGIVRDIETNGLPDYQYDVIVVSNYLYRDLMPQIISQLNKGGLVFYQTWTQMKVTTGGPKNPKFLLEQGELLKHFQDLTILYYHEEGKTGDTTQGFRNQASIIALR